MEESNYWTRLGNRRITRRYLLGASATTAAGLAAMSVVGCGGGGGGTSDAPPTRTPNPDGTPLAGGEIVQGRSINALGIDPHIDLTGLDIDLLLYSYLYGWNAKEESPLFNNFADSLELPDDLTFIFKLRPGFKIHRGAPGEGEELNSNDVLESFVRRGTSLSAPDKRFPFKIGGGSDPSGGLLRAALQAPDPQTFRFTMKSPFVPAIREMSNPTWAIVPAKVIEEYLSLSQDAWGTGPFMLDEFRGTERIVLVKNPDYPLSPRPWLDKITYIIIQENSSLLTAFKSNQHDVCGAFLTKKDYDTFADDTQGRFTTASAPSAFYPCIHLKMRPPFDDIRVRKAIDLALNRDEFISGLQDGEGWYNGPIQHVQQFWALPQDELRAFYKYDPEGARTLLAEAGYENGFKTTMKLPKLQGIAFVSEYALLIQQQLSLVGIDVQLDEVELGTFIGSVILPGNFEMAFFPNLPYDEPDRPLSFYHSLGVTGSGNWTNYNNQALDKLIDKQSEQFDKNERKATILEAQRMILEEHGPQLTLTAGIQYTARWSYVHYPYEYGLINQEIPEDVGPVGTDTWTAEYPPNSA